MNQSQFKYLYVDDKLDSDNELRFELYGESTYLDFTDLQTLNAHLARILTGHKPTTEESPNEVAAALLEVAAAIKGLQSVSPAQSEPEQDRELGVGEPEDEDDPAEWNEAAFNYAYTNDKRVEFDYRRATTSSDPIFGVYPKHQENILPVKLVEVTGPSYDPYKAVLARAYETDGTYVLKTFRLDRIDGYVRVKE